MKVLTTHGWFHSNPSLNCKVPEKTVKKSSYGLNIQRRLVIRDNTPCSAAIHTCKLMTAPSQNTFSVYTRISYPVNSDKTDVKLKTQI